MADDRPAPDPTAPQVHHTIELDADVDTVLEALHDPELLEQWLGAWAPDPHDPSSATVRTDDGVSRQVRQLRRGDDSVTWTWSSIDDPDSTSEVRIVVAPSEDGRSRLTVHEHLIAGSGSASASTGGGTSAALLSTGWVVALVMLQVLMVLRGGVPALV
jgi:uncharacterized protein YndB with AHSA1/START domain